MSNAFGRMKNVTGKLLYFAQVLVCCTVYRLDAAAPPSTTVSPVSSVTLSLMEKVPSGTGGFNLVGASNHGIAEKSVNAVSGQFDPKSQLGEH